MLLYVWLLFIFIGGVSHTLSHAHSALIFRSGKYTANHSENLEFFLKKKIVATAVADGRC